MNENQMLYIHSIAKEGNIQKAALFLGKNPSTLTRVLKNCEQETGVPLFRRIRKRMIPTPEGEQILDFSKEILIKLQQLKEWVQDWNKKEKKIAGMPMVHQWTQNEIRYLLMIREKKSISQAAQELYIAQPSLSQMVKEIESDLGNEIFLRKKEGVEATRFGFCLLQRLEMIWEEYEKIRIELEEFQEMKKGTITLGIPLNLGTYLLPAVIPPFRERFPGIKIRIRENNSNELEQLMIGKKIDFCILHFHKRREQVQYDIFFDDEFFLVIPNKYKTRLGFPEGRRLTKEDFQKLQAESFVMVSVRQKLRLVADKILKNAGIVPDICCTTKSMETAKRLVAAGVGLTLLPGSYLNLYSGVEGLACYALDRELEGMWQLVVAYPKEEKLPKCSREFLKLLQEILRQKN